MALHRNAWTPDTCDPPGCRIEYEFDDELPLDQIDASKRLVRVERVCSAHQGLNPDEIYAAALDENPRKNRALGLLRSSVPRLFMTPADASATNRARLLAAYPRSAVLINGLADDEVVETLQDLGVGPAVHAGEPYPGVRLRWQFAPAATPGQPRVLELICQALTSAERTAARAAVAALGAHVTVR